mgnify:FL=1
MSGLECSIVVESDCCVVRLRGDLVLDHSSSTRKLLFDCISEGRPLIAEMSMVDYIDSSGVASLVEAYHWSLRQGTGFCLAAVSPGVFLVLELVRLNRVFPLYLTVGEGLQKFGTNGKTPFFPSAE